MGTSLRLEENFNNRVLKQNVDFSYKNALLTQDKKAQKQLAKTVNRFHEVHQQLIHQKPEHQVKEGETPTQTASSGFQQIQQQYFQYPVQVIDQFQLAEYL